MNQFMYQFCMLIYLTVFLTFFSIATCNHNGNEVADVYSGKLVAVASKWLCISCLEIILLD